MFAILGVMAFLPMLQEHLRLFELKPLNGSVYEQAKPQLSFDGYVKGSFQKDCENYLKQHYGFREPNIRMYNQYLWDFFHKTQAEGSQLLIGEDDWLYEPWFVEDYYQGLMYVQRLDSLQMAEMLNAEAKRIYQLQHILESAGTHLFVCLEPGKDLVYSEHLPKNHKFHKEKKIVARDFYKDKFEKMGINNFNVEQWFLTLKDTADFMLFPKTGTHWSNIAAVYVADSLIRYLEALGDINMHNLILGEKYVAESRKPDSDLEGLMNLMRPLDKPPFLYVNVKADEDSTAVKPRLLTIGDSYYWNIVLQLPNQKIYNGSPYWYYNSSVYYDPPKQKVSELNIVNEVLSADFIMLSYSSCVLYKMSNDFTKNALMALCYDPDEIESLKEELAEKIRNSEDWYASLCEKAAEKGISIDQAIKQDVDYMFDNQYETFLVALQDSIPTKRSKAFEEFFLPDSLKTVDFRDEVNKVIVAIRSDEQYLEMVRGKAEQNGISLDSALWKDAVWVVNRKIEKGEIVGRIQNRQ